MCPFCYNDKVWCDIATKDACHILLGRPWLYDNKVIYDGFKHTYAFEKDGHKIIVLVLLKPDLNTLCYNGFPLELEN